MKLWWQSCSFLLSKWAKKTIIIVACPNRSADNDPEYFGLAFHHQSHTFVNAYSQATYTKILEVNLFALAYRLFHDDFSSVDGALHGTHPFSSLI